MSNKPGKNTLPYTVKAAPVEFSSRKVYTGVCDICRWESEIYHRARRARYKVREHLETVHQIHIQDRNEPRAHVFLDGGGVVTKTHDVERAQRLIIAEHLSYYGELGESEEELRDEVYPLDGASLVYGRIVPADPGVRQSEGYTWFWRQFDGPGPWVGRGITRAVKWG